MCYGFLWLVSDAEAAGADYANIKAKWYDGVSTEAAWDDESTLVGEGLYNFKPLDKVNVHNLGKLIQLLMVTMSR